MGKFLQRREMKAFFEEILPNCNGNGVVFEYGYRIVRLAPERIV
jgi:hypothetical protein